MGSAIPLRGGIAPCSGGGFVAGRRAAQDLTLKVARINRIRCNRSSRACELMFVRQLEREAKISAPQPFQRIGKK
ncbi:hypothetical protein OVY29_22740 [Sphingopyxis sp. SE2]|uniref:hypothetical protein n=1 Tax=Sphingopyxis sp. SE2 TaxID=1586240 RepID=UPI0028C180F1|nr:hypothetical protein [Sphingopyxis sp. SE2]MDT7531237.1 hypothetical protein [Sphingopyxis sp. SE2]MDT7531479.1 hypothetical protein [Sphingopyxis sp. SE2]